MVSEYIVFVKRHSANEVTTTPYQGSMIMLIDTLGAIHGGNIFIG